MTSFTDKARLLLESGLFDEKWYIERYPDVLRTSLAPAEHFVRIGQHLGRRPREGGSAVAALRYLAGVHTAGERDRVLTDDLRAAISNQRLWDAEWYRSHYAPDANSDVDLLADYLTRSARDPRIDPGPLFSTAYYAEKHPDSKMAPLAHASTYGIREGRAVFDPRRVDRYLTAASNEPCTPMEQLLDRSRPVRILHWEAGNFFFAEIASYLQTVLRAAGYQVTLDYDLPPSTATSDSIVVVAPHEFCVHGPGKGWKRQRLAHAVYLNTEQWHTGWFALAYQFMILSNKAIDMNPASAAGLQRFGISTAFLPIVPTIGSPFDVGRAPLSGAFAESRYIHELPYPCELTQRPYDVLFVGAANERREAALATIAPTLAEFDVFVHCPRFRGPIRQGDADMMSTSDLVQIARNAKILLNIHQGESRYFEWHRLFLFGIMEGCVVLSEPCISNRFVAAGRDYLECELEEMPERLRWLLRDPDGQAEMKRISANCDALRQDVAAWDMLSA